MNPDIRQGVEQENTIGNEQNIVLRMDHVSKVIKGKTIVDGLSFDIRRGEIVGLLGPNGAGKTTVIRMITGLIRMSKGDILVEGIAVLISSHMLAEVEQLCHRAIVIQNGRLVTVAELENGCLDAEEVTLTFRVDAVEPAVAVGKRTEGVQIIRTDFIRNQLVVKMSNADVPRMVQNPGDAGVGGFRIIENGQSLEEEFLKWTGGNRIA